MTGDVRVRMSAKNAALGSAAYLPLEESGLTYDLHSSQEERGVRAVDVVVRNTAQAAFQGIIHAELVFAGADPGFWMPAFLYNRNRGNAAPYRGKAGEIRLHPRLTLDKRERNDSDYWMVRSDRLSHPVVMAFCAGRVYGISAAPLGRQPCVFNGFSCRLGREESSIGYTLGYENAPNLYLNSTHLMAGNAGTVLIPPGGEERLHLTLYQFEATDARGISRVLRQVYAAWHQSPRRGPGVKESLSALAGAIFADAYVQDPVTYSTRVFLKEGRKEQEPLAAIAWTGGAEVAMPMLLASIRLKDPAMRRQALSVIDHIVDESMNPLSGLPFDAYDASHWFTQGWWEICLPQSGHSSYVVGQALYYILAAAQLDLVHNGVPHDRWLQFCRACLEHIEGTKDSEGEVPYLWSAEDGSALEYDAFSGCWCVAAAALYEQLTGCRTFHHGAVSSLRHYYRRYVCPMECYGTPIDTQKAPDSEGILSFIKACRILHELSHETEYLEMLMDGLEYEFTFKFCWNPPIQVDPLKKVGWSACGGSVTSVCNPHVHPMSNNVCDEIAYCYERTGDGYLLQRLRDTVAWSCQTFNTFDGEYDFGERGWMSERFCYSEGLLVAQYEDGSPCSTWRCFLPWGASNLMEGLGGRIWDRDY